MYVFRDFGIFRIELTTSNENPFSDSCPNAQNHNGICYKLINISRSWQEAKNYCVNQYQGFLAEFLDGGTLEFITTFGNTCIIFYDADAYKLKLKSYVLE